MTIMHRIGRRSFLALSAGACLIAAAPAAARAAFLKHFPTRTVEKDTFRFDPAPGEVVYEGKVRERYTLSVDGLVEKPSFFSYADLRAMPQTAQTSDFHCVEGWSVPDVDWGGIRFSEIVKRVTPKPEAKFVVFHSLGKTNPVQGFGHYVESIELDVLLRRDLDCLLVLDKDGKPLSHDRGAPMRLISPFDLAYKSIKFVRHIEFSDKKQKGWWTLANPIYPWCAPVPKRRLRGKKPERSC
jgi:DMSO/TMAO reductase YedYZ molybdopterin-dependent catalytic subunit